MYVRAMCTCCTLELRLLDFIQVLQEIVLLVSKRGALAYCHHFHKTLKQQNICTSLNIFTNYAESMMASSKLFSAVLAI